MSSALNAVCGIAMRCWGIALFLVASLPLSIHAAPEQELPVGRGPGQIGLIDRPNEECFGPAAIAPDAAGNLVVLDKVNRKIVVIKANSVQEIPLPETMNEPQDLLVAHKGYVVAGAFGNVILIDDDGQLLDATKVENNPEQGGVRLFPVSTTQLDLHSLSGAVSKVELAVGKAGGLIQQQVTAAGYKRQSMADPDSTILVNEAIDGPLRTIEVTSSMRIAGVRVIWADHDEVLIGVQESRMLPNPASFVRMTHYDATAKPVSTAYVTAESFGCDIRRPYTRLKDGRIVSLLFPGDERILLHALQWRPADDVQPIPLAPVSDATLIRIVDEVSKSLELANGTSDAGLVSLDSIGRGVIVDRARAALSYQWRLNAMNYLHADTESICDPPAKIWERPARLNGMSEKDAVGIPYRWGGYVSTLGAFQDQLGKGRLAGDICTCRKGNCVHSQATGMDCSGFVSYAWSTGKYFTTASLPGKNVSTPIGWDELKPGDIVNKARSHVMLIENIQMSSEGRLITVIESTPRPTRCGGVCRNTYTESSLRERQYLPFRRVSVID